MNTNKINGLEGLIDDTLTTTKRDMNERVYIVTGGESGRPLSMPDMSQFMLPMMLFAAVIIGIIIWKKMQPTLAEKMQERMIAMRQQY